MITRERLTKLLRYDPDTGVFTWNARQPSDFEVTRQSADRACAAWNTRFANKPAGYLWKQCIQIRVDGVLFGAHILAWFIVTGSWPESFIDHADFNPHNNKWSNLRLANHAQNGQNRPAPANNTSGAKGVYWDKSKGKWSADIWAFGVKHFLGRYEKLDDAKAAYAAAAIRYHGEFARAA